MSAEVLEAVNKLAGNIETKAANTAKEIADIKSEFEKKAEEANQKITDLTKQLEAKGATIEQILGEQKEFKAKANRPGNIITEMKSVASQVKDLIYEQKDAFAAVANGDRMKNMEIKTVANISSANLSGTGNNYISYLGWQDGMEPIDQARFRSLVRTIQSDTDFVRYPRANSPIGEGSFSRQSSEGAGKSQVDRDYTMIDLTLKPMSGYGIVSRQSLRNITFLQQWLPTSMLEQLQDQEDIDFSNTLYFAATGSTSFAATTNNMEKIVSAIANLKKAKYQPNAVAVASDVWTEMILYKAATSGEYTLPNVVTVDPSGTVRILGIPVICVNWLTTNQAIVGDWRKAAIIQSEGLVMRQSDSHSTTFTTNEVTFLLERTEGLAIFRPDAFIATTL